MNSSSPCRCADRDAETCAFAAGAPSACECSCHGGAARAPAKPPVVEPWRRIVWTRHCEATGCDVVVAVDKLMCTSCWKLVPRELQQAVWKAYRPGQEQSGRISRPYVVAALAAIDAVARAKRDAAERERAARAQRSLF